MSVRLANLPNGASAELCELTAEGAAARMVSVALQREGEQRVQTDIACTSSLWSMLERLEVHTGSSLVTGVTSRGEVCDPSPQFVAFSCRFAFSAADCFPDQRRSPIWFL